MSTKSRTVKSAYTRTRVKTNIASTKTKAIQSEKTHSDINHIVAKAHKTGQLPMRMGREPIPVMPDVLSYQDALNKVVFAQQSFEQLPSNIRSQFDNDPVKMLTALEKSADDPELKTQLQNIGLLDNPELIPLDEQSGVAASGGEATAEPTSTDNTAASTAE